MGAERESRRPDVFVGEFNPSYELVWLVVAVSNWPKLKFHSFCNSYLLYKIDYKDYTDYMDYILFLLAALTFLLFLLSKQSHHLCPLLNILTLCNVYSFLVY